MAYQKKLSVGVREFRSNLTRYLKEVAAGNAVLVTSRGTAVAELKAPVPDVLSPRCPGALKGRIHMTEDFDRLPDDIQDAMDSWEH